MRSWWGADTPVCTWLTPRSSVLFSALLRCQDVDTRSAHVSHSFQTPNFFLEIQPIPALDLRQWNYARNSRQSTAMLARNCVKRCVNMHQVRCHREPERGTLRVQVRTG